jgi:hypothetical protein
VKAISTFALLIAALAAVLVACSPAPSSTPAPAITQAAVTGTPLPPPTTVPSPTPWVGRLPEGTIALYTAGSLLESRQLYALSADGSSTDLGRTLFLPAIASPSGRWVASLAASPARAVLVRNLQDGRVYTIPCTVLRNLHKSTRVVLSPLRRLTGHWQGRSMFGSCFIEGCRWAKSASQPHAHAPVGPVLHPLHRRDLPRNSR